MQLKEIVLKDFCQFRGEQKISFSTDKEKNVTMIIGENGSGKTIIAQAFTWCLYGKTKITDSNLLCHAIELSPNKKYSVWVELKFIHNEKDYSCKRELLYYSDSNGEIKPQNSSKLKLSYEDSEGQTKTIDDLADEREINKILPEELSDYFFFDGEHITEISKDIINKGKVKDFSDAVKRLLGLSSLEKALEHLKGNTNQNSVIKIYNKSFNDNGDIKLKEVLSELDSLEKEESNCREDEEKMDEKISYAEKTKNEIEIKLNGFKDIKNKLEKRGEYKTDKESTEKSLKRNIFDLFKYFNDYSYNFFNKKLIKDVIELLASEEIADKGIPDITNRTLNYIRERKKCICGRCVEENSEVYNIISELYKYIPPQSLGGSITTFKEIAREKMNNSNDFFTTVEERINNIYKQKNKIDDYDQELSRIGKELENHSNEEIASLEKDLDNVEKDLANFYISAGKYKQKIEDIMKRISDKEKERDELIKKEDGNKEIKRYLTYAKYIYNKINISYLEEEKKLRNKFEETINVIFKQIYNGGFSLKINEKYIINVIADEFNYAKPIEISTGQSSAIILSFISTIIKMAKEAPSYKNGIMARETYPLVMDAPTSVFDETRVKTVCEVLPKIAEQVIIFINDKDGAIANENMKDKIDKRYKFNKKNEFETQIEEQ